MVNLFEQSFQNAEYDIRKVTFFSHVMPVKSLGNPNSVKPQEELPAIFDGFKVMQPQAVNPETSLQRSIRRTKKIVRDKVFNNFSSNSRFLTLTYSAKGCFDKKEVQNDIKAMIRRIEAKEKKDVKYIATLEFHKTGHGLHVHMLINCNYYKNETFQELFWRKGFVKLIRIKKEKEQCKLIDVEKYLIKYLLKDAMENNDGKPRYLCSRNLKKDTKCTMGRKTEDQFDEYKKEFYSNGWSFSGEYTKENENGVTITGFIVYKKRKYKSRDIFGELDFPVSKKIQNAIELLLT